MPLKDYYQILGVNKDATDEEIKKAYKKLVHMYHPDVSDVENAQEIMKEINEAYDTLSNQNRRKEYDIKEFGIHANANFDFGKNQTISDDVFFDLFFGKMKTQNHEPMNITLKQDEVIVKTPRSIPNPVTITKENGQFVGTIKFGKHTIKIMSDGDISLMDYRGQKTKIK